MLLFRCRLPHRLLRRRPFRLAAAVAIAARVPEQLLPTAHAQSSGEPVSSARPQGRGSFLEAGAGRGCVQEAQVGGEPTLLPAAKHASVTLAGWSGRQASRERRGSFRSPSRVEAPSVLRLGAAPCSTGPARYVVLPHFVTVYLFFEITRFMCTSFRWIGHLLRQTHCKVS